MTAANDIKERLRAFEEDYRIGPVDICLEAADRIEQLERDTAALQARIAELEAMVAAQAGQEHIGYVGTEALDAFQDGALGHIRLYSNIEHVRDPIKLFTSPPAPASAIAIVQAALEAAVKAVESITWPVGNSGWGEGYQEGAGDVAKEAKDNIRAIDPQTIIEGVGK